ncbi:tol-pal system-associated acyl-CoA thioesterase [Fodinicurvata sediminis]|uniref:tol-pal system-associated acyl-CoA thioesterase n=1 Tax=Fodinicurvata sediminis TaxID=1121832 RepID=UPI0003B73D3D|nr:tol-pal system-associated acyl-CoA thioesterase [Fodinicurvata sediminis]
MSAPEGGQEHDLSGWFDGKRHVLPIRVYYEDTDAGGIVYYANYLRFAERARTEFLRSLSLDQKRLREDYGLLFVVRRVEVDYEGPARLDDLVQIHSSMARLGGARLDLEQDVMLGISRLVSLKVQVVTVDAETTRARRLPAHIRDILMPYSQS